MFNHLFASFKPNICSFSLDLGDPHWNFFVTVSKLDFRSGAAAAYLTLFLYLIQLK